MLKLIPYIIYSHQTKQIQFYQVLFMDTNKIYKYIVES